ncbi:glycosyltransferase family 39 protein [Streptomyces sp. NPDC000594]|uniref:glycosyltransferase family 39 protein n=1 Tax=Streptomyces sp. NPDC000594 TaxID=3154261 RepID=UPI003318FFB2
MIETATVPVRSLPPKRRPAPRTPWAVALPPAALALALGLWGLEREGTMWSDEAVTYDMAGRSLPGIWRTLGSADAVHGLYYLLMHAVFAVWDPGLVPLRLPSVLATAATAALVARIGARLAGPRAGLLSGLVLALLPVVQRYAQEGRSYALVCALVAWGTLLLLERRWRAYTVVMLIACLLHEFAVLALVAHAVTVWPAGRPGGRGLPRDWRRAAAVVCCGLAPLAVFSMTQSAQLDWVGPPSTPKLVDFAVLALVGLVCGALPGGGAVRRLALPLLVLPMGLLIAVSFAHPLYVERYVLFHVVGLALLLGAVLDRLWSPLVAGGAVVTAVVHLTVTGPQLRSPESRSDRVTAMAGVVAELARPGDAVLFVPGQRRVWSLAPGDGFRGLPDLSLDRAPRASHTLYGTEASPGTVRERLLDHPGRVLVVADRPGERRLVPARETAALAVLERHFRLVEERTVSRARIGVYIRDRGPGR